MCGNYDFFPGEFTDLRVRFNLTKDRPLFKPCFNIAPGKDVPVFIRQGDRSRIPGLQLRELECSTSFALSDIKDRNQRRGPRPRSEETELQGAAAESPCRTKRCN